MKRVAVAGITGRTGSVVTQALADSGKYRVVAGLCRPETLKNMGSVTIAGEPVPLVHPVESLKAHHPEYLVDFTPGHVAAANLAWALEAGVIPITGSTGIPAQELNMLERAYAERRRGGVVAPNFSVGSAALRLAALAVARHFPRVQLVEMHREGKLDAPSGTALEMAEALRDAGLELMDEDIKSIRLPGLVAHHSVIFGAPGEYLALEHHALSREAFVPGVFLALDRAPTLDRLVVGLSSLLRDSDPQGSVAP